MLWNWNTIDSCKHRNTDSVCTLNSPLDRFPFRELAHPQQRHVRWILHRRHVASHLSRSPSARLERVRCLHHARAHEEHQLGADSRLSPPRRFRRSNQGPLDSVNHASSPAANLHTKPLPAACPGIPAHGSVRRRLHRHAARHVFQRIPHHLHIYWCFHRSFHLQLAQYGTAVSIDLRRYCGSAANSRQRRAALDHLLLRLKLPSPRALKETVERYQRFHSPSIVIISWGSMHVFSFAIACI